MEHCIYKMNSNTKTIDKSETHSSQVVLPKKVQNYPEWIQKFNSECLKICGTKCSEKLDELMESYIKEIKKEMILCTTSPNRSTLIAGKMCKMMTFFNLYHTNLKECFIMSQWNEYMVELLSLYCQLEMKAALRVTRGKSIDATICSRIMSALWTYLGGNDGHMIHVILKVTNFSKKYKDIFDPIFKKLLLSKTHQTLTELEYIRNLLAFKLWKRLYCKDEKKAISQMALTELKPPQSFQKNYRRYKFLPSYICGADIHSALVTALFNLETVIQEYFEYVEKNKKSFTSDFDVDHIEMDDDDDVIIIEDNAPPIAPPTTSVVIDLTNDEPDTDQVIESDDVFWCKEIIKLSEELTKETLPDDVTETEKLDKIDNNNKVDKEFEKNISEVPEKKIEKSNELPKEIQKENMRTSLLDVDESSLSEDNSLREITSTSHPVQDNNRTVPVFSLADTFSDRDKTGKNVEASNETFEHVDSTSNLNEEEECESDVDIEVPTVKTYVVESTLKQTQKGDIVCSEVIHEIQIDKNTNGDIVPETVSAGVLNTAFEQFVSLKQTDIDVPQNDEPNRTLNSRVCGDDDVNNRENSNVQDIMLPVNSNLNSVSLEAQSQDKESEGSESVYSQAETEDFLSPVAEPMTGSEFADYYEQFKGNFQAMPSQLPAQSTSLQSQPSLLSLDEEWTVNKKRRNKEYEVRKYSKRKAKEQNAAESSSHESVAPDQNESEMEDVLAPAVVVPKQERRVPLHGEKICHFATEDWELSICDTFNLSKLTYKILNPRVVCKKEMKPNSSNVSNDSRDDYLDYCSPPSPAAKPSTVEPPFSHLALFNNSKTIIERQDYLKNSEKEPPRARVIRRPMHNHALPSSLRSLERTLLDGEGQKKKRGPRNQTSSQDTKKRKTGRRKTTRSLADSTPDPPANPTTVEKSSHTTPWRFSFT